MNSHHQSDHSRCHQLQMDKTQLWEFMGDISSNDFTFALTVFFLQILSKIPGGMLELLVVMYVLLCSVERKIFLPHYMPTLTSL